MAGSVRLMGRTSCETPTWKTPQLAATAFHGLSAGCPFTDRSPDDRGASGGDLRPRMDRRKTLKTFVWWREVAGSPPSPSAQAKPSVHAGHNLRETGPAGFLLPEELRSATAELTATMTATAATNG